MLWLMKETIIVEIIGAPVACAEGVKESWREVAEWAAQQLNARYGSQVRLTYYDLFDTDCPALPPDGQLPLVLVNGMVISSGGKISIPLIRKKIEELKENGH
jgi:disulfide oxidoreductase YuzD